jgi:hypothetical protein
MCVGFPFDKEGARQRWNEEEKQECEDERIDQGPLSDGG